MPDDRRRDRSDRCGPQYDLTGSYSYALDLFVIACILGALATLACLSLESEQSRLMPVAITPA